MFNVNRRSILEKGRAGIRKKARLEYLYEKESLYFAQVPESVKELAKSELQELGAEHINSVFRGMWFKASMRNLYRIIYRTRLISRILAPLASFPCHDKDELYRESKKIRWEEFLSSKKTLAVNSNVSESDINNSQFAALRVKDAVADYFMDRANRRPSVDTKKPFIEINIHIHRNQATLSIDISGGALHKRGYREEAVSAPMQEIIAASIIRLSGWDGSKPLYDPMCGSGTLLCEALMSYCNIPAQIFREKFGFERLPDFDPVLWQDIKKQENDRIKAVPKNLISGSDIAEYAVQASKTNLMGLHYGNEVNIRQADFRDIEPLEDHFIIANPPYGIRMGKDENLSSFYQDIGLFLKNKCKNSKAFIFFGDPKYIKKIPLAPRWKQPLTIGGLDGKLVRYDIF